MPDRSRQTSAGFSADLEPDQILDLRGLKCPLPVLRTRRALARAAAGTLVEVRCTDPLAALDIPNLVRESGDVLLLCTRQNGETRFHIRKSESTRTRTDPAPEDPSVAVGVEQKR